MTPSPKSGWGRDLEVNGGGGSGIPAVREGGGRGIPAVRGGRGHVKG